MTTQRVPAGIRPTGPLHLGHYAGTQRGREIARETMALVRQALDLDYFAPRGLRPTWTTSG